MHPCELQVPCPTCFFLTSTDPHFHLRSASSFLRLCIRTVAHTQLQRLTDWLSSILLLQCQTMGVEDSIGLINSLQEKEEHKELCIRLAQTFLVQNWIRTDSNSDVNKVRISHLYEGERPSCWSAWKKVRVWMICVRLWGCLSMYAYLYLALTKRILHACV